MNARTASELADDAIKAVFDPEVVRVGDRIGYDIGCVGGNIGFLWLLGQLAGRGLALDDDGDGYAVIRVKEGK